MSDDKLESDVKKLKEKVEQHDKDIEEIKATQDAFIERFKSALGHLATFFWGKRGGGEDDDK